MSEPNACMPKFHRPASIGRRKAIFYVVFAPSDVAGVYLSWHQVAGLSGITHQSFETAQAAIAGFQEYCALNHGGQHPAPPAPSERFSIETYNEFLRNHDTSPFISPSRAPLCISIIAVNALSLSSPLVPKQATGAGPWRRRHQRQPLASCCHHRVLIERRSYALERPNGRAFGSRVAASSSSDVASWVDSTAAALGRLRVGAVDVYEAEGVAQLRDDERSYVVGGTGLVPTVFARREDARDALQLLIDAGHLEVRMLTAGNKEDRARIASKDKRSRGRQSSFTKEQLDFLIKFVEEYCDPNKPRIKGDEFWARIIPVFYELWPLPSPEVDLSNCTTDEERDEALAKAKQAQLRTGRDRIKAWYARYALKVNRQQVWRREIRRLLSPQKGKPRPYTESTMFRFYGSMDEYKEKVEDRAVEILESEGRTLKGDESIAHWSKVAKELWEKESEDVREEVREAAAVDYRNRYNTWERNFDPDTLDEAAHAEARANLAGSVKPLLREICRIAQFTAGIFVGGLPANKDRPRVTCFDVHYGQTLPIHGSKEYHEFDNPVFKDLMFSFADFTHHTVVGGEGEGADGQRRTAAPNLPPLLSMTDEPQSGEGGPDIDAPTAPRAETRASGSAASPQLTAASAQPSQATTSATMQPPPTTMPPPPAAPTTTPPPPAVSTQTASSSTPTRSSAPARDVSTSTPADAATSSTSRLPALNPGDPSPPSTARAPRLDAQPRGLSRPKPKAVAFDVPAKFSTMFVKDFVLDNAFRGLLQRMPPSAREKRLSTMERWQLGSLKRANNLARQNAELGASTSARDKETLKEIFQAWEDRPQKAATEAPPAANKRKRNAREEDEADYESDEQPGGAAAPPPPRRITRRSRMAAESSGAGSSSSAQRAQPATSTQSAQPPSAAQASSSTPSASTPDSHPTPPPTDNAAGNEAPTSQVDAGDVPQDAPDTREGGTRDKPAGAPPSANDNDGDVEMHDDAHDTLEHAKDRDEQRAQSGERGVHLQNNAPPTPSIFDEDFRRSRPSWLQNCFDNVETLEGGEDKGFEEAYNAYRKVVELWAAIEQTNGDAELGTALSPRCRPAFVGAWVARARRPQYVPDLLASRKPDESEDDAANAAYDEFRHAFQEWWHHINPPWRLALSSSMAFALDRRDGDWSPLYRPGKNGLISVVKCLKWWWDLLLDVDEEEGDREVWREAVEEVAWTFEQVLNQQRQRMGDAEHEDEQVTQLNENAEPTSEPPAKRAKH
ncbi:hypothetical protein EV714DRAFT_240358 [Schizophyllum commune]